MGRIFGPAVEKAMPVMLKVALGSVGVLFVAAVTEITAPLITVYKRLKEPVDITDPILSQDLTRDTCIYGALAKSMEACREMRVQKESIRRLSEEIFIDTQSINDSQEYIG